MLFPRSRRSFAIALVLAAGACGGPAPQPAQTLPPITPIMIPPAMAADGAETLAGRTWAWQDTRFSDDKRVVPDAPERYTVEFLADGHVQLRADCNRGNARFEARPERRLTISPAAMTKMGCPRGTYDAEFLRQLGLVDAYLFVDGNLVLTFKFDSGSMRFAPLPR